MTGCPTLFRSLAPTWRLRGKPQAKKVVVTVRKGAAKNVSKLLKELTGRGLEPVIAAQQDGGQLPRQADPARPQGVADALRVRHPPVPGARRRGRRRDRLAAAREHDPPRPRQPGDPVLQLLARRVVLRDVRPAARPQPRPRRAARREDRRDGRRACSTRRRSPNLRARTPSTGGRWRGSSKPTGWGTTWRARTSCAERGDLSRAVSGLLTTVSA